MNNCNVNTTDTTNTAQCLGILLDGVVPKYGFLQYRAAAWKSVLVNIQSYSAASQSKWYICLFHYLTIQKKKIVQQMKCWDHAAETTHNTNTSLFDVMYMLSSISQYVVTFHATFSYCLFTVVVYSGSAAVFYYVLHFTHWPYTV